jgi:hypothetical protein
MNPSLINLYFYKGATPAISYESWSSSQLSREDFHGSESQVSNNPDNSIQSEVTLSNQVVKLKLKTSTAEQFLKKFVNVNFKVKKN